MLRMNYLGTYEYGALLWMHYATDVYTECFALTMTEDNKVIVVGNFYNGRDPADLAKESALIIMADETLAKQYVKIWSASTTSPSWDYATYGRDVAVTSDGSIFVTGYTNGWASGNNDCFILKLDY
jgi:hypothetical protein